MSDPAANPVHPCAACGHANGAAARFCESCGHRLGTAGEAVRVAEGLRVASDRITDGLGIERIGVFSASRFFSEVFRRHDPDEAEALFGVGTRATTPPPTLEMASLPSPWVFFRVLAGAVLTYFLFLYGWLEFRNLNMLPGLIIVGSFAVPLSILILFFELNTPRNVSMMRVMQMVMAGGALSLVFSLFLFDAAPFLGALFGASAAGIVEECAKLLAVLAVLRFVPVERYPYRLNGLLFGAAVGTGFAAFESAGYALRIGLVDADAMLANITLRGVMSPFAHIAWTAITACAYLSVRREHPDFRAAVRDRRFLTLFGVAVGLHFIWNLPFEGPLLLKFWILGFVAWVVILSLVQSGLREAGQAGEPASP